jgi:transcription termination factor NusB
LRVLLEERFGTLPASAQQRLGEWPADRLATVEKAVLRAQSLREIGLED